MSTKRKASETRSSKAAKRTKDEGPSHSLGKEEEAEMEEEVQVAPLKGPPKSDGTISVTMLEKGHIYFFYRPRVEIKTAHNINEVQRLYVLLVPVR